MIDVIKDILEIAKNRVNNLHNIDSQWYYKWRETFINAIKEEIEEMEQEIKKNNSVYLEDELWDIFWVFICLVETLQQEWLIDSSKSVFDRCYTKYSQRLWTDWMWGNWKWKEIKKSQKEKLKKEHTEKFWKK